MNVFRQFFLKKLVSFGTGFLTGFELGLPSSMLFRGVEVIMDWRSRRCEGPISGCKTNPKHACGVNICARNNRMAHYSYINVRELPHPSKVWD